MQFVCFHQSPVHAHPQVGAINTRRKINLTELRHNTRSRRDKRSGRKAPRPGDYDVTPAPDAIAAVS